MSVICLFLTSLLAAPATAPSTRPAAFRVADTGAEQVLLVLTDGWDAVGGTLWRFERDGDGWRRVGDGVPVVVGHAGLAWGRGLHPAPPLGEPRKREGDGRGVAGVFRLGTAVGYAPDAPAGVTLPYRRATRTLRCVDDPASSHYNRVVDAATVPVDWKSAEKMRRRDALYRWLVVVDHNIQPAPEPGAGSCIFLHIWRAAGRGTAGCTAMAEGDLVTVMRWLKPEHRPLLVQLPRPAHAALREAWGLPNP